MSRKRKKSAEGGGAGWLTTYADLMTLLLCFFVLLYAMSTPDEQKYQTLIESLREAIVGQSGKTVLDSVNNDANDVLIGDPVEGEHLIEDESLLEGELDGDTDEEWVEGELDGETDEEEDAFNSLEIVSEIRDTVSGYLNSQGLSSTVTVEVINEGVLLDIKEQVLFDLGKASIKPESLETLNKLGTLFKKFDNHIRVIGHTDNIPINTAQYPSNWELAAARSCAIVRYYSESQIAPNRLMCLSEGDTNPIDTNETELGRSKNRRVNFLIEATPEDLKVLNETLKNGNE